MLLKGAVDCILSHFNTFKCESRQLMHWDTFKQDNCSTVGGDGGCRVGEVRAGTTSPMPDHKGFKLQQLSEIHALYFQVNSKWIVRNLALWGLIHFGWGCSEVLTGWVTDDDVNDFRFLVLGHNIPSMPSIFYESVYSNTCKIESTVQHVVQWLLCTWFMYHHWAKTH